MIRFLTYLCLSVITLWAQSCHQYDGQTEHGYNYWEHLKTGGNKPSFGDEVFVFFQIRTQDTLIYSSPNGIKGMRAVLQDPSLNPIKKPDPVADILPLMSVGDSVTVVMKVTDEMRVAPGLASADLLYYDVVLRRIVSEGSHAEGSYELQPEGDVPLVKVDLREQLAETPEASVILDALERYRNEYKTVSTSTKSGLYYTILAKGSGKRVQKGENVWVKYIGSLEDGTVFGENFTQDTPFSFTAGKGSVIKAWEECLDIIGPGGQVLLAVPPSLAYGNLGKAPFIGPEDTLFYYFELLEASKFPQ
ncbi:FKBP-type peptidyl-prolyl cis-trans isomerase [Lewinella cohaerens]|uniref:FKBP-type peptidyl-prolyl cis-trans isomerase n=1 Tax=Lewinella cohaerens TaxID=70995 RepID=UPI00035E3CAD|nr:FKBP-type peptidyl-prolyl cis-trans isomerase [Lewinella cohaerens]